MRRALLLLAALLASACAGLQSPPAQPVSTYVLEGPAGAGREPTVRAPALEVSLPRARAGFDTARMAYTRRAHEIEYFASHRWADTPARMLAPLIAHSLERSGCRPGTRLRLDSELVRLVQDFGARPSQVRLTLRAELIDPGAQRLLAAREFDEIESAPSDDPYGGVIAANRALERLLGRLVEFCSEETSR